jgi:hypothetical protein
MTIWTEGMLRYGERPHTIARVRTSSRKACPVEMSGPANHPLRADWLTTVVETGPGVITALKAIAKEIVKSDKSGDMIWSY